VLVGAAVDHLSALDIVRQPGRRDPIRNCATAGQSDLADADLNAAVLADASTADHQPTANTHTRRREFRDCGDETIRAV
jgi:hypothetical protein